MKKSFLAFLLAVLGVLPSRGGTLIQDPKPVGDPTALMAFIVGAGALQTDPQTHKLSLTLAQFYTANPPDWAFITGKPVFASVATSGSYTDLANRPALFSGSYLDLTNRPALFSGNYTDLQGKPTLFSGSYLDLTNRPNLFSGSYADLTNKPNFAPVATSGQYGDLQNKPVAGVDFVAPNGSGAGLTNLNASRLTSGTASFGVLPPTLIHNYTTEATSAITARISGKTAGASTEQIFSQVDDNAHVYLRNPNLWCADLDFTCVSATTSVGWRITMISPRHGLTAHHIGMPVGTVGYWVDALNNTYSATVTSVLHVVDDMDLVVLDHELPASIHPASVLPVAIPNGFQTGVGSLGGVAGQNNGVPVITHDQNRHFCIATLNALQYQTGTPPNDSLFMQNSGALAPWNRNNDTPGNTQGTAGILGDSSSPYFVVVGGQPVLIGCFASTVGAGPDPGAQGPGLQTLIGMAGYTLNVVPMPGYPITPPSPAFWDGNPGGVDTHLIGGFQEAWNGAAARTTLQGANGYHAFLAHTTGNAGMAIIGWSSTGSQAMKAIQDTYYTQPALTVYRSGSNGASTNAPAIYVNSQSVSSPLLRLDGASGKFQVNGDGTLYIGTVPDGTPGNNTLYYSTTQNKLCYKDFNGVVHPLYQ